MVNNRLLALALAVVHHGLSCLAEGAIPARNNTILNTADDFQDYLDDVPIEQGRPRRR